MNKNFMVYATHEDKENNMSIECNSIEGMDNYADACKEQGYKEVYTKVKIVFKHFNKRLKNKFSLATCRRCKGLVYLYDKCPHCGQLLEWGE